MTTLSYAVGDMITYQTFGGDQRTVVVTATYADVKNGRPGFDARYPEDVATTVWGYDSQVVRVHRGAR